MDRLALIKFEKFTQEVTVDPQQRARHKAEWAASIEIVSCLQPDFERLTWGGKPDVEALYDLNAFLCQAVGGASDDDRDVQHWTTICYHMCMFEAIAQSVGDLPNVIEYCVKQIAVQHAAWARAAA